jgi:hypothetical protein
MKAIHGGKAKTDKIDAHKIAVLLRGGMLPQAYVYPKGMRETRDLLRRRTFLVRCRAEALVQFSNTNCCLRSLRRPKQNKDCPRCSMPRIKGSTAFGGGLYVAKGSVTLTNDTLSSNHADTHVTVGEQQDVTLTYQMWQNGVMMVSGKHTFEAKH